MLDYSVRLRESVPRPYPGSKPYPGKGTTKWLEAGTKVIGRIRDRVAPGVTMALSMSVQQAQAVVCAAFEGKRPEDEILEMALGLCGITRARFVYLRGEMRRTSVGRDRACVLTPTGGQNRRRR